jgi:TP901 family phage tail tape measure protein
MQQVGVSLVAEGADAYLNTLNQVAAAETKLASAADPAVAAINALDDAASTGGDALTQLGQDAETGGKGVSGLGQIAIGAARQIGVALVDAAAQAGKAIVQFVGDSIGKAGDFEQGMNRFASVTGAALAESGQSLDDFKELFISLGRELPVSTAEVQQAAIEMAKGGIEPATIAAGGLRDVLNLAAAGEVSIGEAAAIAAKQLGVWVDQAAPASEKAAFLRTSVDLLAQAANASTVGVDSLALGLANTGKTADIAGLSFRETVTSMALIAGGFSSAADAGTSFKTFLARLQPTTDAQAESFKTLGLLTADGTSKFYDAQGAFIGMDKAAQLLQDSLSKLSPAQKEMALQAAFGSDAIRAAGMLADAGAKGYDAMAKSMNDTGSAAVQAAKKQQGFNVAVENMMGSLEALQITIGSALLPVLTRFVGFLADGINAITKYVDATVKGETFLAKFGAAIQTFAIPAIAGVTAALVAYALVQTASAIPAIYASIPALAAQATAFYANAAAIMAALAPYALIAVAIGGVVLAYNNFTSKVSDATTQLLESRRWWNDSTAAIEDYATQTGEARKALAPYATTITNLRDAIQGEIKSLAERDAAGLISDEQRATEMAHINTLRENLTSVTSSYTTEEQAVLKAAAASMTATTTAGGLESATATLGTQAGLTAQDIETLGKKIEDTFAKGQEAIQTYATNYSEFASGVEQRSADFAEKIADLERKKQDATTDAQKTGIDEQIAAAKAGYADQENAAASSYAAQQAAQNQHLGQMLIDYTVAQAQLGNIAKEKAAEITAALEKEYGLQESSTATTFLHMAGSIDKFASSSGASIQGLVGDLRDQQRQAGETQRALDQYAKEYVATQTNNFLAGKIDADEYRHALENIPKEINTTVTTTYRNKQDNRGDDPSQQSPGRALGGPIESGQAYLVGEKGPEMIIPSQSGTVLSASETRRAIASVAQLGGGGGGARVISNQTIINVDARGSSLTQADITRGVQAGLLAEGRSVDVRVRTGGLW